MIGAYTTRSIGHWRLREPLIHQYSSRKSIQIGHVMPSTCNASEARLVGLHTSPNLPDRFCAVGYNPELGKKHPHVLGMLKRVKVKLVKSGIFSIFF